MNRERLLLKVGIVLFAQEIEVKEEVTLVDAGDLMGVDRGTLLAEGRFALAVMAVGTEDSLKLLGLTLQQKLEGRHIVEEQSQGKDTKPTAGGQVLVEHAEVVAEIEVGLAGVGLRKGAATNMVDSRLGAILHAVAFVLGTPAKVYLLHVGKEIAVKATKLMPNIGTHKHSCTRRPEYLTRVVILAVVFLHHVKQATTAEGIAIAVDEATRGTGIFKGVALVIHQ